MNQMTGYYIREYHPKLHFFVYGKEIRPIFSQVRVKTDLYPFISQLSIEQIFHCDLEIFSNVKIFDALKTINLACNLTDAEMENVQNLLKNVENIHLGQHVNRCDIFEKLANYCPKLKYLTVCRSEVHEALFLQRFPTLEHLAYWAPEYEQNYELKKFLEKHSNLRRI